MTERIYSAGEVADILGVQQYQIAYALTTGKVAKPRLRFCGKNVFSDEDVARLAAHFGVRLAEARTGGACSDTNFSR